MNQNTTGSTASIEQMLEITQRMMAAKAVNDSRAVFAAMGAVCSRCRRNCRFDEATQTWFMCRCMFRDLQRVCDRVEASVGLADPISGLRVAIHADHDI